MLTLSGCASSGQWVAQPWATLPPHQAHLKCQFEAEKAVPSGDFSKSFVSVIAGQEAVFWACMKASGFFQSK